MPDRDRAAAACPAAGGAHLRAPPAGCPPALRHPGQRETMSGAPQGDDEAPQPQPAPGQLVLQVAAARRAFPLVATTPCGDDATCPDHSLRTRPSLALLCSESADGAAATCNCGGSIGSRRRRGSGAATAGAMGRRAAAGAMPGVLGPVDSSECVPPPIHGHHPRWARLPGQGGREGGPAAQDSCGRRAGPPLSLACRQPRTAASTAPAQKSTLKTYLRRSGLARFWRAWWMGWTWRCSK